MGSASKWRETENKRYSASAIEKGTKVKEKGTERPRGSIWYSMAKEGLAVFVQGMTIRLHRKRENPKFKKCEEIPCEKNFD